MRSVPGARYTFLMSLPMTPNPPTAAEDAALVDRALARVFGTAARDDAADEEFGATAHVDAMAKARRAQLATMRADPAYDPFEQDRDEDLYGF